MEREKLTPPLCKEGGFYIQSPVFGFYLMTYAHQVFFTKQVEDLQIPLVVDPMEFQTESEALKVLDTFPKGNDAYIVHMSKEEMTEFMNGVKARVYTAVLHHVPVENKLPI